MISYPQILPFQAAITIYNLLDDKTAMETIIIIMVSRIFIAYKVY